MQIRVALCDDETVDHEITKKLLAEYRQKDSSVSFELSCFSSARELLDYIDTYESFHIYILDI
ncbi:MAG: hypothetical protein K2N85_10890, partial [Lachnospiraceae bacterium]|nr:hypothetical protein [Lachnospiraceae bacterium]